MTEEAASTPATAVRTEEPARPRPSRLWVATALFAASIVALKFAYGVAVFVLFAVVAASAAWALRTAVQFLPPRMRSPFLERLARRAGVVVTSAMLALVLVEVLLQVHEWAELRRLDAGATDARPLGLPPQWDRRDVAPPGEARHALYWYGKLHVYDEAGMRRSEPWPQKRSGVLRVIVVGDSNTYGRGVAEPDTYPRVLEAELRRQFNVEVLNLGVCAHNSTDAARVVREYVPRLQPDLVVYGVCLNDFIGPGHAFAPRGYEFPLPERFKTFVCKHTLTGKLIDSVYDCTLMWLRLREDFFDQVVLHLDVLEPRFAKDVRDMNKVATDAGLPPVVGMVVNQFPRVGGSSQSLTQVAERCLAAAGMDVVPADPYIREYAGRSWSVGRYDGHPNESAHLVYAGILAEHLRGLPTVQRFRQ